MTASANHQPEELGNLERLQAAFDPMRAIHFGRQNSVAHPCFLGRRSIPDDIGPATAKLTDDTSLEWIACCRAETRDLPPSDSSATPHS